MVNSAKLSLLVILALFGSSALAAVGSNSLNLFEFRQMIFALDRGNLWNVIKSEHIVKKNQSWFVLELTGPQFVFKQSWIKPKLAKASQVFAANFDNSCFQLILLDGKKLDYQSWIIDNESDDDDKFHVKLSEYSGTCAKHSPFSAVGNLKDIYLLQNVLANQKAAVFVTTTRNNTVINLFSKYFIIKMDLSKKNDMTVLTKSEQDHFKQDGPGETVLTIYRDKYAILQSKVCLIETLEPIHISNDCIPIKFKFHPKVSYRAITHDPFDDSLYMVTKKKKSNKTFIIILVSVISSILVLVLLYLVIVRYCCHDNVSMLPFSAITSKFVKPPKSVSSIVTLDSDMEQVDPNKKPAPLQQSSSNNNNSNSQPAISLSKQATALRANNNRAKKIVKTSQQKQTRI